MSIVNRIRAEGLNQGLKIASIEKITGLSNGTISKWDKSTPSADSLYKVAKLLGCSMEYLFVGDKKANELSSYESDWLNLYVQLSQCNDYIKNECIGFVKGYIARGCSKDSETNSNY